MRQPLNQPPPLAAALPQSVCVGPAASSKSYLNIPRVLDAIARTGAQAVHPGYGFLSENAAFAESLEARGVKFIGPRSYSMTRMSDKVESKQTAMKAGVSTIPGYLGTVPNDEEAVRIARDIGYPVMIKAARGGGGKGMRVAWNDDEVRMGYRLSKEEARNSFGNDSIFVEKYIEEPRHIEIQLIADSHGNVVALPERECSVQRRNQKVIEESPSVLLDEKTRRAMQEQAASLARAVGYESAGTVEFLADKHRNFYFLEMNTRLQVEHPVTEMVTGLDLVELMIRVAAGERLPASLTGAPLPILGHAFESRVYAEDPFRGFLPSTGRMAQYAEPGTFADRDEYLAQEIRADAGVREGSEISMFYDPMICKLITHGPDRASALDRMRAALDAYVIRGLNHNVAFLRDLCDHPRFMEGRLSTAFIPEEYPHGFKGVVLSADDRAHTVAGAAVMHAIRSLTTADIEGRSPHTPVPDVTRVMVTLGGSLPPSTAGGAKAAAEATAAAAAASSNGEVQVFAVSLHVEEPAPGAPAAAGGEEAGGTWVVTVQPAGPDGAPVGEPSTIRLANVDWSADSPIMFAELPDRAASAARAGTPSARTLRLQHVERLAGDGMRLQMRGQLIEAYVRTPRAFALARHMLPKPKRDFSRVLVSPMPGTLVSLAVEAGQEVEQGQELAVVEAMKMQNVLRSPKKGKVRSIARKPGETLAVDQVILEFD
jgi:propionyl-CoA carboxylase alpha chain